MDQHTESVTHPHYEGIKELWAQFQAAVNALLTGAAPATPPPPTERPHVTRAEQAFLRLLCHPNGYGIKEIAAKLGRSVYTLREYQRRIAKRHGIKGKSALVAWALRNGWG